MSLLDSGSVEVKNHQAMVDRPVVVITGACGDIGKATALAFAKQGAQLALNDLGPDSDAKGLVEAIAQLGADSIYLRGDVSNRAAVDHLVRATLERFGRIDICIGNAGIVKVSSFLETSEENWNKHLSVNLTGCFHVGQAAARTMVDAGRPGKIIFTSSWVQDVPWENIGPYCVSKSGLKMLAQCMALELGPHKITVNLVAPGFVNAGLSGRLYKENPGLIDQSIKLVPLGYLMSADDVAAAVLLLCSPGAEYMTGSTLLVDGGNSLFQRSKNP
jgi:NAD(P)-dependent dehydrogenase (short-subunit alcohol dehydrogenase family)